MDKKVAIAVVVGIVVLGGAFLVMRNNRNGENQTMQQTNLEQTMNDSSQSASQTSMTDNSSNSAQMANVKEFTVTGSSFKFDPSEIKVNKGDTVKITFKNSDGVHDFVIDELNVHSNRIKTGEQESVQFVADKTGTFEYYCSVGNHRMMGMKGNLIVQ